MIPRKEPHAGDRAFGISDVSPLHLFTAIEAFININFGHNERPDITIGPHCFDSDICFLSLHHFAHGGIYGIRITRVDDLRRFNSQLEDDMLLIMNYFPGLGDAWTLEGWGPEEMDTVIYNPRNGRAYNMDKVFREAEQKLNQDLSQDQEEPIPHEIGAMEDWSGYVEY